MGELWPQMDPEFVVACVLLFHLLQQHFEKKSYPPESIG